VNEYSKYLTLKVAIENLFGTDAWYALKESGHLATWRNYSQKTLRALELSINDTVEICDVEWLTELRERIDRGVEAIREANSIDEVISIMAATLIEVSFLQVGLIPRRRGRTGRYPLRKGQWKLDLYRSVAYFQTKEQKEAQFWSKQQQLIGFQNQQALHAQYRESRSKLSYSEWCAQPNELSSTLGA
jgi:hypothetical protein